MNLVNTKKSLLNVVKNKVQTMCEMCDLAGGQLCVIMCPPPLQEGCEAVPHRATVYAQLVESELLWSWAQLQPVEVEGTRLVPLPTGAPCAGAHAVCDIQLSQVPPHSFTPLGPLCTMFKYESKKLVPQFSSLEISVSHPAPLPSAPPLSQCGL